MQTGWREVVKFWPIRSLQTKATPLVIAIVVTVLGLSTLVNIQDSQRALERDTRDEAIALARQFAGCPVSMQTPFNSFRTPLLKPFPTA